MLIQTTKGLIDKSELEIKDIFEETDNSRSVATEFWHKGELVRRDAWVNILRTQAIRSEQATI